MTAIRCVVKPLPKLFYFIMLCVATARNSPYPRRAKIYIIHYNRIDGFMKKRDLVIPNAVRNLIFVPSLQSG